MIALSRNKVSMAMMLLEQTLMKSPGECTHLLISETKIPRFCFGKASLSEDAEEKGLSFFEELFMSLKSVDDDLLVHLLPQETAEGHRSKKDIYSFASAIISNKLPETHKILWTKCN
jgi:hypothetical protein